jgi:hypothetical protein
MASMTPESKSKRRKRLRTFDKGIPGGGLAPLRALGQLAETGSEQVALKHEPQSQREIDRGSPNQ